MRQVPPDSALARSIRGDDWEWDLANQLRAATVDVLRGANWQRENAGAKTPSPRPEPIPRPGVAARKSRGDAMPIPELRRRIAEMQKG